MTNLTSAIISRPSLSVALAMLKTVTTKRAHLPILESAKLATDADGLYARATDLDLQATIRLDGSADTGFAAMLPVHQAHEVERKAPGGDLVTLDFTDDTSLQSDTDENGKTKHTRTGTATTRLDYEGLRINMQSASPADFPELAIDGQINADFTIPSADLLAALEAVAFAISTEETRYYLNGVFVHVFEDRRTGARTLRFVATDGHRMAVHDMPAPEGCGEPGAWGSIIPRATVAFLIRVAKAKGAGETCRVLVNCSKVRFTLGRVDVLSKLIDGTYPDYVRVWPAGNSKIMTADRREVIRAIEAVATICDDRGRAAKWQASPNGLTLSVRNPDIGDASMTVPCRLDSVRGNVEAGFNSRYALDVLKAMGGDEVEVAFEDSGSPTIFLDPANRSTTYVLMPMRV